MLKALIILLSFVLFAESAKLYRVPLQRSLQKLTPENYLTDYICTDIYIGLPPQKERVLLDTGSANLWVPSLNCQKRAEDPLCQSHNQYNENESMTHEPMSVPFVETGNLEGHLVADTVRIGNVSITGQVFAAITKTLDGDFIQHSFDGIFGMGFHKLAVDRILPPFYNIYEQGWIERDAFSFYLKRGGSVEDGGVLILGGSDPELYKGELTYAPVTSDVYWQVTVNNVDMLDERLCERCEALIDTGTVNIAVPSKSFYKIMNILQADSQGLVDCRAVSSFPTMNLSIGGRKFTLEPKDYIIPVYKNEKLVCASAFIFGGTDLWILGNTFMHKYYTEFDKGSMRIGFADAI